MRRQSGFTLLELMMVVAIIGILMGIAMPAYRAYGQKAARAAVEADLLRLAADMERFKSQRFTYTNATLSCTSSPCDGGTSKYTIAFIGTPGTTFEIGATSTDSQDGDSAKVEALQINQLGQKCGKPLNDAGTTCTYGAGSKTWSDLTL